MNLVSFCPHRFYSSCMLWRASNNSESGTTVFECSPKVNKSLITKGVIPAPSTPLSRFHGLSPHLKMAPRILGTTRRLIVQLGQSAWFRWPLPKPRVTGPRPFVPNQSPEDEQRRRRDAVRPGRASVSNFIRSTVDTITCHTGNETQARISRTISNAMYAR